MRDDTGSVDPPELKNAPMPSRVAMGRGVVSFFVVLGGLAAIGGLVGGRAFWVLDLCNHFWLHYVVCFTVSTVSLLLLRGRKALALSMALLGLSVWQVAPLYLDPGREAGVGPGLELLHLNVNTHAGDPAAVAAYLRGQDADIVFLQEISDRWLDELDGRIGPYERVIARPQDNNFGIVCYLRSDQQRISIQSSEIVDLTDGAARVPTIALEVLVDDGAGGSVTVPVLSLHTVPPVSWEYSALRDEQLGRAADWAEQAGPMAVVIGDLNATPWSAPMRDLVADTGLHNSQLGRGRSATWPARLPAWAGIAIDHCLHGEGLTSVEREIGPANGSDHRALRVLLRPVKP